MRVQQPTPTPITSPAAPQVNRLDTGTQAPAPAPVAAPRLPATPKAEAAEPLVINMGGTKIELLPNELAKVVDKMNETARIFSTTLRFEVAAGNRIKVRVLDAATGQLVREIPPERIIETFARLEDVVGVMLDMRM